MYKILILLSVLAAVIYGKSVPLLRPMSQDMIDFINNEAQTTWKVCVLTTRDMFVHPSLGRSLFSLVY